MMGSRGLKGGDETEYLSRSRRLLGKIRSAPIRAAKRSFWKRQRKQARRDALKASYEDRCERD